MTAREDVLARLGFPPRSAARALAWLATLGPAAALLGLPIAGILVAAVGGLGASASATASARGPGLDSLASSAATGAIAAAVALVAGTSAAIAALRRPALRRRPALVAALAAGPLLAPAYVVAYAITDAGAIAPALPLARAALAGLVLGLCEWPVVALLAGASLASRGPALEEAGLTLASPLRVLARVTLPLAAPGALAGAAAVFLIGAADYGVPALLQARSFAADLLELFSTSFDPGRTALASLPVALPLVAGAILAGRALARLRGAEARDGLRRGGGPALGGAAVALALAPGCALALASLAAPVAVLALRAGSPLTWGPAVALALPEIARSTAVAAAAAAIACAAALPLAWLGARGAAPAVAPALAAGAAWLFLVPGSLVAIGMARALDRPGALGAIYGTPAPLVATLAARAEFAGLGALWAAVAATPAAPEEAALSLRAPLAAIAGRVVLPALARPLGAALLVAFALAFAELPSALLLAPPGFQTLTPRLFNLMHYGRDRAACAVGLALLLGAAAIGALAATLATRGGEVPA